jgi:hypothetical protein
MPDGDVPPQAGQPAFIGVFLAVVVVVVIGWAVVLAWRHVRRGRGDRRGATRVAAYMGLTSLLIWALRADHSIDHSFELALTGIANASALALLIWVFYIAVEPYARRYWPHALVSWTRLLTGRWRDPLIGRHILFGVIAGGVIQVGSSIDRYVYSEPGPPAFSAIVALKGPRELLAQTLSTQMAITFMLGLFLAMLLARVILRRQWAAFLAIWAILGLLPVSSSNDLVSAVIGFATLGFILAIAMRFGLLTILVAAVSTGLLSAGPTTFDTSAWYFAGGLMGPLLVAALIGFAFWTSLGGQPLIRDELDG